MDKCQHLTVSYSPSPDTDTSTHGWTGSRWRDRWVCRDCGREFAPAPTTEFSVPQPKDRTLRKSVDKLAEAINRMNLTDASLEEKT